METAAVVVAVVVVVAAVWRTLRRRSDARSVAIIVLGDIGRSPRIMYHAQSFASHEFKTYLVGYQGSREVAALLALPRVQFVYLSQPPAFLTNLSRSLFLLLAPFKVAFQLATVCIALFFRIEHPPEFILVQNPPSVPTLALVWLAGRVRGSRVIIDWHNLGYSILALKLGDSHILVRIAKMFEQTFGRSAYAHLFVTRAMSEYLVKEWDLQGQALVLHDRPPSHFHPSSPQEVHDLFLRLTTTHDPSLSTFLPPFSLPSSTPFTTFTSTGSPATPSTYTSMPLHALRPDRTALVVSSTSWTEDEDFGLLVAALSQYERHARTGGLPRMLMIVTGKGPLRERYMREVRAREEEERWEWVRCRSLWLEAEDYPVLLGAADFGISLHTSSSALDLPMKVVDMFGCGLPVLALDFKCLGELVLDGENGRVFRSAEELASHMVDTLTGFPAAPRLTALRAFFTRPNKWDWCTWSENWNRVVRPVVTPATYVKEY